MTRVNQCPISLRSEHPVYSVFVYIMLLRVLFILLVVAALNVLAGAGVLFCVFVPHSIRYGNFCEGRLLRIFVNTTFTLLVP
jgi:hypothetical protein